MHDRRGVCIYDYLSQRVVRGNTPGDVNRYVLEQLQHGCNPARMNTVFRFLQADDALGRG